MRCAVSEETMNSSPGTASTTRLPIVIVSPGSSTTHISSRSWWKCTLVSCPGSTVITRTELGWFSAYVTTFPQGLSTITASSLRKPFEQRRHLHPRHRGVPPLVPVLAAGTIHRLLERVGREHAEDHRDTGRLRPLADAERGLLGHVVEVRRLAPDHGAEADHRRVPAARRQAPRDERQLERAGNPREVDVLIGGALGTEALERARHELADDDLVEPGRDDGEPASAGLLGAAVLRHGGS